jgi:hypothetical protein
MMMTVTLNPHHWRIAKTAGTMAQFKVPKAPLLSSILSILFSLFKYVNIQLEPPPETLVPEPVERRERLKRRGNYENGSKWKSLDLITD